MRLQDISQYVATYQSLGLEELRALLVRKIQTYHRQVRNFEFAGAGDTREVIEALRTLIASHERRQA